MVWDPGQYLRFGDERSQPFFDLVARVPAPEDEVGLVVDLGCGPGQLTATLASRFAAATVIGVDSSPEMIAAASSAPAPAAGRLRFELGDAVSWQPPAPVDVLVSNACLQWVDGHLELLEHWLSLLRPGGWFAFQVPGNFSSPSHRCFADQVRSPRWRPRIDPAVLERPRSAEPQDYLGRLLALGAEPQVWETTYLHVLTGDNPVLEWIRATALRPVLAALAERDGAERDGAERDEFEEELAQRLRLAYPPQPFGTVLPFRRIFAVARRPAASG